MQISFNFESLLRKIEVGDWECLYTTVGKNASDITTGVADGFGDYSFCKLVCLTDNKSVRIITSYDSIKCKVARKQTGLNVDYSFLRFNSSLILA